jgi:hypothetical protein
MYFGHSVEEVGNHSLLEGDMKRCESDCNQKTPVRRTLSVFICADLNTERP